MRLFVGNLAFSVTETDIFAHFQSKGVTPKAVKLMTDRETRKSRGFSFVDFSDSSEGTRAISLLNGTELSGRFIKVTAAEDRKKVETTRKPEYSSRSLPAKPSYPTTLEFSNYSQDVPLDVYDPFIVGKEQSRRKGPKKKKYRDEDDDW